MKAKRSQKLLKKRDTSMLYKPRNTLNMLDKAYDRPVKIWENYGYQKQVIMKPDQWSKAWKFAVVRELKPEEDRKQLSLLENSDYTHAMYILYGNSQTQ